MKALWFFPFMMLAYVLLFCRIYQQPAMLFTVAGWVECIAYLLDSLLIGILQIMLFTRWLDRCQREYHRYITSVNDHLQVMKKNRGRMAFWMRV